MRGSSKTAIILVGGAMKSAHGAGFLWALEKELQLPRPDIMIGSSGNAGNLAYYCADQSEEMKHVWLELLSTPKFISLWRFWRVMNVDYLIDTVFKEQEPIDVEKLRASAVQWRIPISEYDHGRTRYVGAADNLDVFEVLRATMAIPFLFGGKVPIANHRYIDGELGATLQDHLDHAVSLGARNIVIVNNTASWRPLGSIPMRVYARLSPAGMHEAIIRDISTDVKSFKAPAAHVVSISPSKLSSGSTTNKKEKIKATFDRGVADALALKGELHDLFKSPGKDSTLASTSEITHVK